MRVIDELVAGSFTSSQQNRLNRICDRPDFLHVSAVLVADVRTMVVPQSASKTKRELTQLENALRKLSPRARYFLSAGYKVQTQESGFVFPDDNLIENLLAGIEDVKRGIEKPPTARQWIGKKAQRLFVFHDLLTTTYPQGDFVSFLDIMSEALPPGFDAVKLASELLVRRRKVFFFDCR